MDRREFTQVAAMIEYLGSWVFLWHGGARIDIHTNEDFRLAMVNNRPLVPFDTINVWDHAQGKPKIQTLDQFTSVCMDWLNLEGEIYKDLPPNAGSVL
jgi:hypothetical protein